ncbi:MAG: hypothetical protein Q9208_002768 [Pyrenodesmia sp. 3 TL-2023]
MPGFQAIHRNAVFKDPATWSYGKNSKIEASSQPHLSHCRTIDHTTYTFAINGGASKTAANMLKIGTYNAIITEPNAYYSPRTSDFVSSHKAFKRMMPTFAWEVLEVYSGPPRQKQQDHLPPKTQKSGQPINTQAVTVTNLNPQYQIEKLETWFDPLHTFQQMSPRELKEEEVLLEDVKGEEEGSLIIAAAEGSEETKQAREGSVYL